MPAYLRLVIDGGYSSNAEVWSCGLNFESDGITPTPAAMGAWADSAMAYLASSAAEVQQLRASLATVGRIVRVRTYFHASVGGPAITAGTSAAAPVDGSGVLALPLSVSRCYSLQTGLPGGSYRGRVYWPNVTSGIGTGGQLTSVNQSMADNFATFLETLAGTTPSEPAGRPAVVSLAKGLVTSVTSIRVGNVPDTQRRRRDNLPETYFTAPIA